MPGIVAPRAGVPTAGVPRVGEPGAAGVAAVEVAPDVPDAGNVWTVGVVGFPDAVGIGDTGIGGTGIGDNGSEVAGLETVGLESLGFETGLEVAGFEVAGFEVAAPMVGVLAGAAADAAGPVAESPTSMVCRCSVGRSASADAA